MTFSIDPSSTNSACSISGSLVTFGQPGNCVIDANQAGNAKYQAAPQAQQTVRVNAAPRSPGDLVHLLARRRGCRSGVPMT